MSELREDEAKESTSLIQSKYHKYNNEILLNNILEKGVKQASLVAKDTLSRATKALGLN